MSRARSSEAWDHTSQLLSLLANANNDWKKNPKGYDPIDFHPYERAKPKTKEQREAEAMQYHMNQLAQLPAEKFDAAFEAFIKRFEGDDTDGSQRTSDQSGQGSD